jgi:hypothetical protein
LTYRQGTSAPFLFESNIWADGRNRPGWRQSTPHQEATDEQPEPRGDQNGLHGLVADVSFNGMLHFLHLIETPFVVFRGGITQTVNAILSRMARNRAHFLQMVANLRGLSTELLAI